LKIREQINLVRRERVIYDSVFKKIEFDLRDYDDKIKSLLK